MSNVHNFMLIAPAGTLPPALPWAGDMSPAAPKVARWFRCDHEIAGDGKAMEVRVYGLVVNGRDPQLVIDAFRAWSQDALDHAMGEAVLTVKRQNGDHVEIYSSRDGAPRLLGAVRERGRGGLL